MKSLVTDIKSINDSGKISGYASVFNVVDGCNDVVMKGAFAKTVEKFNTGNKPKLLWQHDVSCPIGIIDELYEDDYGLFIKCHLLMDIPKATEIYSLIKNRAIDGFSIGYKVKDSFQERGIKYISEIDLFEISIVTFPACDQALISNVKSKDELCLEQIKNLSNKIENIIRRKI